MAYRDSRLFIASTRLSKAVCRFCETVCSFKSAARHRRNCCRFVWFLEEEDENKKEEERKRQAQRLRRLLRKLETSTNVSPRRPGEKRRCVKNTGRYIDPSLITEGRPVELRLTLLSVFRQRFGRRCVHLPEEEQCVLSFLPSWYA